MRRLISLHVFIMRYAFYILSLPLHLSFYIHEQCAAHINLYGLRPADCPHIHLHVRVRSCVSLACHSCVKLVTRLRLVWALNQSSASLLITRTDQLLTIVVKDRFHAPSLKGWGA